MAAAAKAAPSFQQTSIAIEMNVMVQWFENWTFPQRIRFLESVVPKVVPHKLFAIVASRLTLDDDESRGDVLDPLQCRSFAEQVAFSHHCLDKWAADECNHFMNILEDIDRNALYQFYDMIAATANED